MTVTEAEQDYSGHVNKRVVVVQNLPEPNENGEGAVEIEGTVQAWNPQMGLLVKPKGQVQFKLIPAAQIEEVRLAVEKSSALKRSTLKPVKIGQARRHLLERHGYTLTQVNELTEEDALELHENIDHEGDDLGHVHADSDGESDVPAAA